ncbi:hypothetical protein IAT38_002837 [Cryptococcus sp. DSM 104549]
MPPLGAHPPSPLHRPRRTSSSRGSRSNSRDASPSRSTANFELNLPLAPSSSPNTFSLPSAPSLSTSLPAFFGRNTTNARKMATTRRGNRYIAGAAITLGGFALFHTLGGGSGETAVGSARKWSESVSGWSPKMLSGFQSSSSGSAEVDDDSFLSVNEATTLPETVWVEGVAGFNYFQNLYLFNGTFIAYTSDPAHLPEASHIMSAHPSDDGKSYPPAGVDRWRIIVPGEEDISFFGGVVVRKPGISMFFNDAKGEKSISFLKHYFHFIGEVFLGAWRALTTAGEYDLPARLMYRTTPDDWRDRAGLTPWFQQSVMPNTAIEEASVWEDRAKSGMIFVYDKITISDRWAAHLKGINPWQFNKMTGDLHLLDAPANWMDPLRLSMKRLVTKSGCSVYRKDPKVPVVLYINRQLTSRRLLSEDAESLSEEMTKLHEEGVIEWMDVQMETKSRVEQFCLALRADIIMGVHGNGLSHALWMKPGSAVLEFMMPGGFARDYATTAELMRHDYYSIHKDTVFTKDKWLKPDGWGMGTVPGFHGPAIPLSGKFIAELTRKIAEEKKGMVEP